MQRDVSVLIRQVREVEVTLEVDVEDYARWRNGDAHTADLLMYYLQTGEDRDLTIARALEGVPETEWGIVSNEIDSLWV